jgi:hypothetical protein
MWWDPRPAVGRVIRVEGTQIESARHQGESLSESLSGGFAGYEENCPTPLMSSPRLSQVTLMRSVDPNATRPFGRGSEA